MTAPDLTNPDDAFVILLERLWGPESLIAVGVAVAMFLYAWWQAGVAAARLARRAYAGVSSLDPDGRTRVARTSVGLGLAQAGYLLLSYFIAVELSVFLGLQPGVPLPDFANWAKVPDNAHWDGFVTVWFLIAVVLVLTANYWAAKGGSATFLLWLCVPGGMAGLALVVAGLGAFMGYKDGDPQYTSYVVWTYPVVLGVLVVYLTLYCLAVLAPARFFAAWRESVN
ncbi:hypothetical protein JOF56_004308 [Kibdelosporangium banguiense]|uniref:Uncharacterized protein n=1 Tax=Kibdelosporangium banguiense TaxID=1365924 RepID=A0ABS4THK3_9PSEU|nr:hypothetical protein [Kibdelosporangium banguiense]MBP2323923.1 hypothetical protein [Kibdelosporangium banguiense]